jgi:hypothetical protein
VQCFFSQQARDDKYLKSSADLGGGQGGVRGDPGSNGKRGRR